ncbi:uracil-DNA glycosylase [Bordetella bronchialis]|uniref:Uracil-DNA glycosylase n=1 Tax=Bordetella bronchialis TaxID=463025 RepID=A0A193G2W2_9BORD|nr:uracil-DNA glycosylase [Bordetella bronchialis]ANN74180.1 uracil-DNA glycosylase [Bordetella bronchialis]
MDNQNRLRTPLSVLVSQLPEDWAPALAAPAAARALPELCGHVDGRVDAGATVYPCTPFRALEMLQPRDVKVVILGQDPYHGPGQAQGLAFSVPDSCKRPPSLRNIFKEIAAEYPDKGIPAGNDLTPWVRQGVLLLNTSLTVEDGQPGSHARRGWEAITDALIALVARQPQPKVFMLWGAHAQSKRPLLPDDGNTLVLMANHPSPLSASRPPQPFLGCGHFRLANDWLLTHGQEIVDWGLPQKTLASQQEFRL